VRPAAKLKDDPFYPAAQGEFHFLAGRPGGGGETILKSHEAGPPPV